jgi:hypothetical protein
MSADATLVGALVADPFTGIVIPFVALVGDGPERCLDIVPSPLVIESAANQLCDECAASPASSPLVEFGNELVINSYVQSHVLTIAHWLSASLHLPHPARAVVMISRRRAARSRSRRSSMAIPHDSTDRWTSTAIDTESTEG